MNFFLLLCTLLLSSLANAQRLDLDSLSQELTLNNFSIQALTKNLKHDKRFINHNISWQEILNSDDFAEKKISGKLRFSGLLSLPYQYNVRKSEEGYKVSVKIYVNKWGVWKGSRLAKLAPSIQLKHMKRVFDLMLKDVSDHWSRNDHGIKFSFLRTENSSEADYSIQMRQNIRGSFYTSWEWFPNDRVEDSDEIQRAYIKDYIKEIIHETGHMLGLEDEYSVPKSIIGFAAGPIESLLHPHRSELHTDHWVRNCDQSSVMCKDWTEQRVSDYHFYLILRRSIPLSNP